MGGGLKGHHRVHGETAPPYKDWDGVCPACVLLDQIAQLKTDLARFQKERNYYVDLLGDAEQDLRGAQAGRDIAQVRKHATEDAEGILLTLKLTQDKLAEVRAARDDMAGKRDIARDLLCEVWESECMQESGWVTIFAKVKVWYEAIKCRS